MPNSKATLDRCFPNSRVAQAEDTAALGYVRAIKKAFTRVQRGRTDKHSITDQTASEEGLREMNLMGRVAPPHGVVAGSSAVEFCTSI